MRQSSRRFVAPLIFLHLAICCGSLKNFRNDAQVCPLFASFALGVFCTSYFFDGLLAVPFDSKEAFDPDKFPQCIFRVMRVRNRFHTDVNEAKLFGGYRDIGLKLQIGFALPSDGGMKFMPCKMWNDSHSNLKVHGPKVHHFLSFPMRTQVKFMTVELQLRHVKMLPDNFKVLHARYVKCRNMLCL